jgi:uncharacterized protein
MLLSRRAPRALLVALLTLALLGGGVLVFPDRNPAQASPNQYVRMPDGIRIAINVRLPDAYVEGQHYPTVFEMSGYDGGSAENGTLAKDYNLPDGLPLIGKEDSRQLTRRFNRDYVTVHASVRGSGCSGGDFDVFSWQSALDGKYVIDEWIAKQPWSNGDVAILGHSYSGITGFMVAETQPKHLRAMTVSGLIDDIYRGIVYPGGVSDYGFPLLWTAAYRPFSEYAGGILPGLMRAEQADDTPDRRLKCLYNQTTKSRNLLNDPLVQGLAATDNAWYQARSLIYNVDKINVPIHVAGAWQDEQTGPRGFTHLWEQMRGVPKRLLVLNGDHNAQNPAWTGPEVYNERVAWIDHWMGVHADPATYGTRSDNRSSVRALLEYHQGADGVLVSNGHIDTNTFPLETTRWTDWFLRENNRLLPTAPTGDEPVDRYVSGSVRQFWSYLAGERVGAPITTVDGLPDELKYTSDAFTAPMAVVGPITANLFVQATATDTELFVQLIDEAPDGSRYYLQRGMLRASHRAIDTTRSDYTATGRLYRPWRPHTRPQPIQPLQTYEYLVEVFPLGHVFRPGHKLIVKIHTPPISDSLYVYVPKRIPGINTVLHDAVHPSRLTLPVVPLDGVALGPPLGTCQLNQVRCIK